jgi:hypothetical protein
MMFRALQTFAIKFQIKESLVRVLGGGYGGGGEELMIVISLL